MDIGNTEILFNQFVYLNGYLEKNNTNQNRKATKKLSIEEKWLTCFADTKYTEQKSCLIKLCEYVFAIPVYSTNVERICSLMTTQWEEERNKLLEGDN
ncbi:hypothetical protein AVEN_225213-1 [Araneus ventricosus]|uniref:HAT C-terminal dimerisation domain-containing protein n=1 Tax=Araneus ventricosus TaxID=182803 RepID=A0A4Y2AML8_ARAVE|nr:hypothetical protein AVEN_225213-1 [Araneus ventricosus]